MKLKLASPLLLALAFLSCSDNPTGPDSYKPLRFFPLASGAGWLYSYSLHSFSRANSAGGISNYWEFGRLNLEAQESQTHGIKREFLVNVNFTIDSLKHSYQGDAQGTHVPGDTSYSISNVFDTTFSCAFSVSPELITYQYEDSVRIFYQYTDGNYTAIDLSLFNLGRSDKFSGPMIYQDFYNNLYTFRNWGRVGISEVTTAQFDPFAGGLVSVGYTWCTNCGDLNTKESSIYFNLLKYTPGTAE